MKVCSKVSDAPCVDRRADSLGVRIPDDIQVDGNGLVTAGAGGMSVAPHEVLNLVPHRLPRELGGTGKHPAWMLRDVLVPEALSVRLTSRSHALLEPASMMSLESYEASLASTQPHWELYV